MLKRLIVLVLSCHQMTAFGLAIRPIKELQVSGSIRLQKTGPRHWYVALGGELPGYTILDVQELKLETMRIDGKAFAANAPEVVGDAKGGDLVYYDGETAVIWFSKWLGNGRFDHYLFKWTPKTGAFSAPLLMLASDPQKFMYTIGFDNGKRVYFAIETRGTQPPDDPIPAGPASIQYRGVNLSDFKVDWELTVSPPQRKKQLALEERALFSPDGTKFVVAEYNERVKEKKYPTVPPQQAYVVDIESKQVSTFPIPWTPYGRVFSHDSRYAFIGGFQTGEVVRIDVKTGKIDGRGKVKTKMHEMFLTRSGKNLIIDADTSLGSQDLEFRNAENFKLTGKVLISSFIPEFKKNDAMGFKATPDGKYLLSFVPGKSATPDTKLLRVFEVTE